MVCPSRKVSRAVVCLFIVSVVSIGNAQSRPAELKRGTLNIVLANPNGFVIGTDSRASSSPYPACFLHEDTAEKLFRTGGDQSAASIAGFLSYVDPERLPYALNIPSVIYDKFEAPGGAGEPWRSSTGNVLFTEWANLSLLTALQGVAAIASTYPDLANANTALTLTYVTLAYTKAQLPHITQLRFVPVQVAGAQGLYTTFRTVQDEFVAEHFIWKTAGIDFWANATLQGIGSTNDPAITKYMNALRKGKLDSLSVDEMASIAEAILVQTERLTPCVGGPVQLAIVPKSGPAKWTPRPFRAAGKVSLADAVFRYRDEFSPSAPWGHNENVFSPTYTGYVPVGAFLRLPQFFIASRFHDLAVYLDGNAFVGNNFDHVTFRFQGGSFFFGYNNQVHGECKIEVVPPASAPPPDFPGNCTITRKTSKAAHVGEPWGIAGACLEMQAGNCHLFGEVFGTEPCSLAAARSPRLLRDPGAAGSCHTRFTIIIR